MPQRFFDDVKPPAKSRRLLSDVLPNTSVRRARPMPPPPSPGNRTQEHEEGERPRFWIKYWVFGVLSVFAVGFLWYAFTEKATLTLERKVATAPLNTTIIAREGDGGAELSYVVVTTEKTEEKEVPATGESHVEKKAIGTITIYNNYSSANQRLVKNTRFETPNGRIYRISDSVVVPGRKGTGASATPGSVDALVTADAAGESFNLEESDFTIPGFKGDPRYSAFYGRTKTPIVGGFIGTIKTAKPEDIESAKRELDLNLKDELLAQAKAELPPNYVLFESGAAIRYKDESPEGANRVVRRGTLTGILFAEDALTSVLATRAGVLTEGAPVEIENMLQTVSVQFLSAITVESLSQKKLDIRFIGENLRFIFGVDLESLKADLAGKPTVKSVIDQVFSAYPGIREANVNVRPFWKGEVPENPEKIKVKDKTPVPEAAN